MTYKLEPGLSRIMSPVRIILPDGSRVDYRDGKALTEAVFDKRYVVKSIRADMNIVELTLMELDIPTTTWIGEEQSFF